MTFEEIHRFWKIDQESAAIEPIDRIEKWIELVRHNLRISKTVINENKKFDKYKTWADEDIDSDIRNVFIHELKKALIGDEK